jgi:hypothetical protein
MTLKVDSLKSLPVVDLDTFGVPNDLASSAAVKAGRLAIDNAAFLQLRTVNESVESAISAARLGSDIAHAANLSSIFDSIGEQRRLLANLAPPSIPPMPEHFSRPLAFPEIRNPTHETNERLEDIVERFDKMEKIALKGAEIATGLQSYAADFLVKFERAAAETDVSARRAVWIGLVAIGISIAMPVAQMALETLATKPADVAALADAVQDLRATIADLRRHDVGVEPAGSVVRVQSPTTTMRATIEPVTAP